MDCQKPQYYGKHWILFVMIAKFLILFVKIAKFLSASHASERLAVEMPFLLTAADNVTSRKMSLNRLTATIILASLLGVGCASNKYPPAPTQLDPAQASSYGYVIGAGDRLSLYVWGYDDLSDVLTVRPDGKVTTKLVEDLSASGQTPSQLAREIEKRYTEFVKKPVVTVSVDQFVGSKSQQVRLIGAGEVPISIPFSPDMALLDLVIAAGGIGEFANGNGAVLVRKINGINTNFSLRIDDLLDKGSIEANVPLLPGDIIVVPESRF